MKLERGDTGPGIDGVHDVEVHSWEGAYPALLVTFNVKSNALVDSLVHSF
jgi:hypothetical protein